MAGVRVGSLDLKLAAPAALRNRASGLARRAEEDLIPAVLRAMERRLVQTHGESAVIRIRSIDLRLKLRATDLASPRFAESIGDDISEQLIGQATIETASAHSRGSRAAIRIWKHARQLTAARLSAAARREAGPDGEKENFGGLWAIVANEGLGELALVLNELAAVAELAGVVSRLSGKALQLLSRDVAPVASTSVRREIERALESERSRAASNRGAPQATAQGEQEREEPKAVDATDPAERRSASKASPPPDDHWVREETAVEPGAPDDGQSATDARHLESRPAQDIPTANAPPAAVPKPAAGTEKQADAGPLSSQTSVKDGNDPIADMPAPALGEGFASDWCGLAYLLPIAMKTDLPEALWQAGLDEGAVLAHAFALIAGGLDDPMIRILSRRFPAAPPLPGRVADWARDEVTATGMARAIALGADKQGLAQRIALFAASLAMDGEQDFAAWLAAYLLAMFESGTGLTVEPGALKQCFARHGRVEIDDDIVRIVQPLNAIDIAIRRAGLDSDPGWLPWIEKTMKLVFEGDEAA